MELIEQLYEENHRELYNYLLRLTGDSLLSEDLLSETFLQAIRSIPSFRGDSSIKTWLFGVARNCWLQYLRKERPILGQEELLETYIFHSFEEETDRREKLSCLINQMNVLPDQTRQVLRLRMQGYSYKEIAQKLAIQESSARVVEFRGKKELYAALEKEGY